MTVTLVGPGGTVDVSDRAARLLGHVVIDSMPAAGAATDVTDRAGRLLGAVTGPLTDAQLRLTPVPVSGTLSGTVGLTDTQLRATPVPVSFTASGTTDISDRAARILGHVVVDSLPAGGGGATEATSLNIARALTDYETRLEYDGAGNLVYVGKNLQGTATATATWVVQKLLYDASNRLIRAEVLTGSWDNRATLPW